MSRTFEGIIDDLSKETGYSYDFLVERYNETFEEDDDWEYFVGVTRERDW